MNENIIIDEVTVIDEVSIKLDCISAIDKNLTLSKDKVNNALEKDNGKAEILPEYEYTDGRYGYYENVYKG